MISGTFGLSETGSVRSANEDSYLLDSENGLFAVADGLGGLPNGAKASKTCLEILHQQLLKNPRKPLLETITDVNLASRQIGFGLDALGYGTTLTLARFLSRDSRLQIAHVGDSAAYLVRDDQVQVLTVEHTVAARMAAMQFEDVYESIPPSAHHTLTQCIGQDLYIDPQLVEVPVHRGDRVFLLTDGVTKPMSAEQLYQALTIKDKLDRVCQALTFRIEIAGSPDNYTVVALEV